MTVIETRLTGRQASLSGATRFINRQLGTMVLTRVELRYSTEAAEPLVPQQAKQAIGKLLRENGFGNAAISVHAHESQLDNATGEHVLRLYPVQAKHPKADEVPSGKPASGLLGWLARIFPRWFGKTQPASQQNTDAVQSKPPAITKAEAVAHLRKAVAQAAAYVETDTGTAIVATRNNPQTVGEAQVIVRLPALNEVLGPLLLQNPAQSALSIAPMVNAQGLKVSPGFCVTYAFKPRVTGDGTTYASESDIEVVLRLAGSKNTSPGASGPKNTAPDSSKTAMPGGTAMPATASGTGTALPPRTSPKAIPPALTVHVLGTFQDGALQAFASPFELIFATLPARLDRNALEKSAFAAAHPQLMSVASNSCPLHISQGSTGSICLQSPPRRAADGQLLYMYRQLDSLAPVQAQPSQVSAGIKLVVNDPGGVLDPASGNSLPALVIQLHAETKT